MQNLRLSEIGAIAIVLLLVGCSQSPAPSALGPATAIGNPDTGRALIHKLGCGSCHSIPGIVGGHGMVGPPLDGIASRQFIAGVLRNNPENMTHWLRFPQQVVPGNAMPDLAISEDDARQITAYLATLR